MPHWFARRALALKGLFAGFIAAMLTIILSVLGERSVFPIIGLLTVNFNGWIFGAVIAAYFYFILRKRSILAVTGFILACTAAFGISVLTTMFLVKPEMVGNWGSLEGASFAISVGGAVGAFLVLLAAFMCFSENRRAFLWAAPSSVLGGVFGVLGSAAAQSYYSIFLVWQTGMGLVIGWIFSREQEYATVPEDDTPEATTGRNPVLIAFLAIAAVTLALVVYKFFPEEYEMARIRSVSARHAAEKPSLDNLPGVQALPPEQVLIVKQLGEYGPKYPEWHPFRSEQPHPRGQRYALEYHRPGEVYLGDPYVRVELEEFPNAKWASWELRDKGNGIDWANPERPVKFGSRLYGVSYPETAGGGGMYCWTSDNRVLCLRYYRADPDVVLQAYLQKYPAPPAEREP